MLEAIVALPDQLFYNTGIATYIWLVTNRKPAHRRGRVQLINGVGLFQKMRKSLGDKRNELGKEHIETIVRVFGAFEQSDISKIFDNEDLGYRRITVERPLRLSFQVTPERIERLKDEGAFVNLPKPKKKGATEREVNDGRVLQQQLLDVVVTLVGKPPAKNRDIFESQLESAFGARQIKLSAPIWKALLSALSERDDTAEICRDAKGAPESDADLRDSENVPLKARVETYFEREVKPHVPDAWIDERKTKIGYEIPFTRHFYQYKPLRPLDVIEAEIKALEADIQGILGEVLK
jgi:type I restriction enzyme M protein